ncbi:hypothetical protein D7D26_06170 [Pyramidobacter sp. CG50-2]|nr:hypothetical protein D7D26_06170 [Pyramidobacter sp. CG50-2]
MEIEPGPDPFSTLTPSISYSAQRPSPSPPRNFHGVTSVEGGGYQLEHDKGRQFVSPQMVEDKRFFIVGSVVESFPRSKVVS